MNVENRTLHRDRAATLDRTAEPGRKRSAGILSSDQVDRCRSRGIALAFDPVQIGWVMLDCEDDLARHDRAPGDITFRPWRPDDAPALAAMLSSERLWRFLPETFHGPIDAQAAAQLIEIAGEDHHEVSAVVRDDVPIGQVRLLFSGTDAAELSYWLAEEHWGKGYAGSFVRDYCDRTLARRPGIRRLFARVHEDHRASQRVLEKAGFASTGRDGVWIIFERSQTARH